MLISSQKIAERLALGTHGSKETDLVIRPTPDLTILEANNTASVDLRLGCWFSEMRQNRVPLLHLDDDAERIAKKAKLTPDQMQILQEYLPTGFSVNEMNLAKSHYVPFGKPYVLHPGNFVLGVTLEWIRLPHDLAGYVIGRSSWGRRGLIIATAVGVHPNFTGCLTLELSNVGEIPIAIKPGVSICQLFVHLVETSKPSKTMSPFSCSRRPSVGKIHLDDFARKLSGD
jgi:dCTP deaminase